jgi:hypothetical protein
MEDINPDEIERLCVESDREPDELERLLAVRPCAEAAAPGASRESVVMPGDCAECRFRGGQEMPGIWAFLNMPNTKSPT